MRNESQQIAARRRADRRFGLAVSAIAVTVGALLYATAADAASCVPKHDFLVRGDRLMAPVRPADCSHVYQPAADFAWPAQKGAEAYVITLTFPDGHEETRETATNWFAWDAPLAPGTYTWRLSAAGGRHGASAPRSFTVEG